MKKSLLDKLCDKQMKFKWGKSIRRKLNDGSYEVYYESDLCEDYYGDEIPCALCEQPISNMYELFAFYGKGVKGFSYCSYCVLGCEDTI